LRIEHASDGHGVIIVQSPFSVELVIFPLALIRVGSVGVGEHSKTVHFVVFPISFIAAAFGVVEFSCAVAFAVSFEALVFGADLVLLYDVFAFGDV
jgi:hypothetical protein